MLGYSGVDEHGITVIVRVVGSVTIKFEKLFLSLINYGVEFRHLVHNVWNFSEIWRNILTLGFSCLTNT